MASPSRRSARERARAEEASPLVASLLGPPYDLEAEEGSGAPAQAKRRRRKLSSTEAFTCLPCLKLKVRTALFSPLTLGLRLPADFFPGERGGERR